MFMKYSVLATEISGSRRRAMAPFDRNDSSRMIDEPIISARNASEFAPYAACATYTELRFCECGRKCMLCTQMYPGLSACTRLHAGQLKSKSTSVHILLPVIGCTPFRIFVIPLLPRAGVDANTAHVPSFNIPITPASIVGSGTKFASSTKMARPEKLRAACASSGIGN